MSSSKLQMLQQQARLQKMAGQNQLENAKQKARSGSDAPQNAEEAAEKFEALFLKRMFNKMREAYSVGGGKNQFASKIYKERFTQHIAQVASERKGIGLAEQIQEEWGLGGASESKTAPESPSELDTSELKGAESMNSTLPENFASPLTTGQISSEFGYREHPIHDEVAFHEGTDVAAPRGTQIKASSAGRVTFTGRMGGYGKTVEIEHPGGWTTRYAHAEELDVEEGQWVEKGQDIGSVGSTGQSTGPHLHFELRKSGRTFDPAQLLMLQNDNQ